MAATLSASGTLCAYVLTDFDTAQTVAPIRSWRGSAGPWISILVSTDSWTAAVAALALVGSLVGLFRFVSRTQTVEAVVTTQAKTTQPLAPMITVPPSQIEKRVVEMLCISHNADCVEPPANLATRIGVRVATAERARDKPAARCLINGRGANVSLTQSGRDLLDAAPTGLVVRGPPL